MAAELVEFARQHASVNHKYINTCFQTLVEVMTNTHNHARGGELVGDQKGSEQKKKRPQKWFVSVYCRGGTAYFSFIDLGVGILNSVPARTMRRRLGASISSYGRIALLKAAFEGKIGSATNKPGRGLGLPRMKRDADKNMLLDLQVLTSDVVGSVSDLDFRSVSYSLSGTMFRWCTRSEESNDD